MLFVLGFIFDPDAQMFLLRFMSIVVGLLLINIACSVNTLTVTDKCVCLNVKFLKKYYVVLPVDYISSVGTGLFKSICVGTPSAKIFIPFVKNRDEIFDVICDLITKRNSQEIS